MIISEIEKDGAIEEKNYRGLSYSLEKHNSYYCLVRYNSIGIPEFLEEYLNLEEAREAFKNIHKKSGLSSRRIKGD